MEFIKFKPDSTPYISQRAEGPVSRQEKSDPSVPPQLPDLLIPMHVPAKFNLDARHDSFHPPLDIKLLNTTGIFHGGLFPSGKKYQQRFSF
jgi:hypothetical protein